MRSTRAPLKFQLRNLKASFRRIRQTASWKRHVHGGYAVLEITWNAETATFHPHLHIVATGNYWPQRELSEAWSKCSHGSRIVDVRMVKTTAGAVHYLTNYLAKLPKDLNLMNQQTLCEWYHALHGERFLIRFGKAPILETPPDDESRVRDWTPIGTLVNFLEAAARGDARACSILIQLRPKKETADETASRNTS